MEVHGNGGGGFVGMLSNPVVLIGGGVLGVVLLLKKPSAGSSGNTDASATAGAATAAAYAQIAPVEISAQVAMNSAALGAEVDKASINADLAKTAYAADTAHQATVMGFLTNQDNNLTQYRVAELTTQAGVLQSQITSAASVQIDANGNATRLGMAYIDAYTQLGVSHDQTNALIHGQDTAAATAVATSKDARDIALGTAWATEAGVANTNASKNQIAEYQYKGVKAAAKASTIGSIVGGAVGIAAVGAKAFA